MTGGRSGGLRDCGANSSANLSCKGRRIAFGVGAFFVFCFVFYSGSPFYTHRLYDPDDYMRLHQVANWMAGQGWFDLSVPRMSPGAGTVVHWSRLIDIPIAVLAWPFVFALGINDAVLLASFVVPFVWFVALLTVVFALSKTALGVRLAGVATAMVLFAPMLLVNFAPGRVDHHGAQIVIAGFGLLSLLRMVQGGKGFAVGSALALACGFWIGAEALPGALLFIACLGACAAWFGGSIAREAAVFGGALAFFTTALVPVALPGAQYFTFALSWFSSAYAVFAALAGAVLVGGYALARNFSRKTRVGAYLTAAVAAGTCFFIAVPAARLGPFADYNAFDASMALRHIAEAQPLWKAFAFNPYMSASILLAGVNFLAMLALPLLGLGVCFWKAWRGCGVGRVVWLVQCAYLASFIGLAVFWQARTGIFMELFAIVPLTAFLGGAWGFLRRRFEGRALYAAEASVFLLLGALPVVVIPALVHSAPLRDVLLFPAARSQGSCALDGVLPILNDPERVGDAPLTIMNVGDVGPQLLFKTRHNVISGNFNVPGNADAFAFFSAVEDMPALEVARKWGVDLVLVCKTASTLYFREGYFSGPHVRLLPGEDGLLRFTNVDKEQPLIERLRRGYVPSWLETVELFGGSDYLLFRVKKGIADHGA